MENADIYSVKKEKWIYLKYCEKLFADPRIVNKGPKGMIP